jgi:hypothetical protein
MDVRCNKKSFNIPNVEDISPLHQFATNLELNNPHDIQNWLLKKSSIQLQN